MNITCMAANDRRYERFSYTWTKNNKLLGMVPGKEIIEDLYPVGTILKIFHAQVGSNNILFLCLLNTLTEYTFIIVKSIAVMSFSLTQTKFAVLFWSLL